MSDRQKNSQQLSRADADELDLEILPYWLDRNILERTRAANGNPVEMQTFERIVFFLAGKAGTISHTVPCYRLALEKGVDHLISLATERENALPQQDTTAPETERQRTFYQATRLALQGITTYAANLSREATALAAKEKGPDRRANLMAMAEVCARVPAGPAQTFRQAVNSLWLLQVGIHAENINMAISPGRLDQILFPYYQHDIEQGTLTVDEAFELLACLWLKLNDNTNLVPETAEELFGGAGTVPAVTVGGVDEAGEDAVNDLTYLILRVAELMGTRDPSLNARYHPEQNTPAYRDRVAEVIAHTKAIPALYNDLSAIATLEHQGVATPHARDYAIIGCVELSASGRSYDASSSIMLNLGSVLELTLYNGKRPITGDDQISPVSGNPATFKSFDEFWQAFAKQLGWLIGQAVRLNEMLGHTHGQWLPTPLLSALFEGPLAHGRDLIDGGALYNSSGATHIGLADTVDSLSAIEQAVFIDHKYSLAAIIAALKDDFAGQAAMQAYLTNKTPKFGRDPLAKQHADRLIAFLFNTYQGYTNYRGGHYRPAFWTMTNHAGQGRLCGALPNGRRANQVFASGITPVSQAATDLCACLQAVGGIDPLHIPGGVAFNLKYSTIRPGTDDLRNFTAAVESYFATGGLHIQFNIMDYTMLLDARQHPDKYPGLLVRVSGYSAYFKDLNEAMQEEIITRTAYDLTTGHAAAYPAATFSPAPTPKKPAPLKAIAHANPLLQLALEQFLKGLESAAVEDILQLLLNAMDLAFVLIPDYHRHIKGFNATYCFLSQDRSITVSAFFKNGAMRVREMAADPANITVTFSDGKALMGFLLAPKPDILGSMLRQEVRLSGNLNYLYKFAFLAKRLQLLASGGL